MARDTPPADWAPSSAQVFHILLSLADGPRHGYGVIQEVEQRTGGGMVLGSGTLYSAIKRMRASGWVEETQVADPEDPRRRYYRLTEMGRQVVQWEARYLESLVDQARAKSVLAREGA